MSDVTVYLPPVSEDRISNDLVELTEALSKQGVDISSGFLGGEYGYGAYFENDVFMMHPFCWCEADDCAWCAPCLCDDTATRYFSTDGTQVDGDAFFDAGGYRTGTSERVRENECGNCRDEVVAAPNFLHKPSGTAVRWYKYIGRGMEADLKADWRSVAAECLASIEVPS